MLEMEDKTEEEVEKPEKEPEKKTNILYVIPCIAGALLILSYDWLGMVFTILTIGMFTDIISEEAPSMNCRHNNKRVNRGCNSIKHSSQARYVYMYSNNHDCVF